MQQRAFLLGLSAPPRGKWSCQNGPGSVISQQKCKSIHNWLDRDFKKRNALLQDLLTGLCSHDSQSLCLALSFRNLGQKDLWGLGGEVFSNLSPRAPFLDQRI